MCISSIPWLWKQFHQARHVYTTHSISDQACNDFENNGTCVKQCPQARIYDPDLFRVVPNPNARLAAGDLCVLQCPSEWSCGATWFLSELYWRHTSLNPAHFSSSPLCPSCFFLFLWSPLSPLFVFFAMFPSSHSSPLLTLLLFLPLFCSILLTHTEGLFELGGNCLLHCPENYFSRGGQCIPCAGPCPTGN